MKFKKLKMTGRITTTVEWDKKGKQYLIKCKFFSALGHGGTINSAFNNLAMCLEEYYFTLYKNKQGLTGDLIREWNKFDKNFERKEK